MYDTDGAKLRTWRLADRINDLIVCPDGKSLLYIESNKKINVLRLNEEREVRQTPVSGCGQSLSAHHLCPSCCHVEPELRPACLVRFAWHPVCA